MIQLRGGFTSSSSASNAADNDFYFRKPGCPKILPPTLQLLSCVLGSRCLSLWASPARWLICVSAAEPSITASEHTTLPAENDALTLQCNLTSAHSAHQESFWMKNGEEIPDTRSNNRNTEYRWEPLRSWYNSSNNWNKVAWMKWTDRSHGFVCFYMTENTSDRFPLGLIFIHFLHLTLDHVTWINLIQFKHILAFILNTEAMEHQKRALFPSVGLLLLLSVSEQIFHLFMLIWQLHADRLSEWSCDIPVVA